jgi:LuxR family maltose regulon positive regulatory protein
MAWKTPLVEAGLLREPASASIIPLDSAEWFDWVADERHCSFHFRHADGEFTARKESKQRGSSYWIAYRQVHNKLYKRYLGKPDTLTAAHMLEVATEIAQACPAREHSRDEESGTDR